MTETARCRRADRDHRRPAVPRGSDRHARRHVVLVEMFGRAASRAISPTAPPRRSPRSPAGPTAPPSARTARSTSATTAAASRRSSSAASLCRARSTRTATSAAGSSASTPTTGEVTDLYTECDGTPLRAPNDLVMDGHGGFWFTDHGIRDMAAPARAISPASTTPAATARRSARSCSRSTRPTASACHPTAPRCTGPRPTPAACSAAPVAGPGSWSPRRRRSTRRSCSRGLPGIPAARLARRRRRRLGLRGHAVNGGITAISPDGAEVEHVPTGDPLTTNICFGGGPAHGLHHAVGHGPPGVDAVAVRRAAARPSSTMSWLSAFAEVECCYVTTTGRRTGRRHEIEIWFGVVDDTMYLISGNGPTAPTGSATCGPTRR